MNSSIEGESLVTLNVDDLKRFYSEVILQLGGSAHEAQVFAETFVLADLRGVAWQGLRSLKRHIVQPIRQGHTRLGESSAIISQDASSLLIDGKRELGQVVCRDAIRLAITKARECGSCAFVIRSAADTGLLAAHTMMAADEDCIGIMYNNTRSTYVAAWGGSERATGIGPLSIAIPAGKQRSIVVDMALTETQGPWSADEIWYEQLATPPLMFFQTVREYALTVALETISGALGGMTVSEDEGGERERTAFGLVIDVAHFVTVEEFHGQVDEYVSRVKAGKPSDGCQEIFLPGERASREQERRLREGIPVPRGVWLATGALAHDLGVNLAGVSPLSD